jgi:hypothetical protein
LSFEQLPKCGKKPGTEMGGPTMPNATTSQKRRMSSVNEASSKRRRGTCYRP